MWVPNSKHEALRDLVRAREATKEDQLRAKHRLLKYLLRYGQRPADDGRSWTAAWWQWVRALRLPDPEQNATLLELVLEVDHRASALNASILLSTKPSLPRPSNCEPSSMRCKLCEGSPK